MYHELQLFNRPNSMHVTVDAFHFFFRISLLFSKVEKDFDEVKQVVSVLTRVVNNLYVPGITAFQST